MNKQTVVRILYEMMWGDGVFSNIIPNFIIYSNTKDIFLSTREYNITLEESCISGVSKNDGHISVLSYDSIGKIVQLKDPVPVSHETEPLLIVKPQELQTIRFNVPFEVEVEGKESGELFAYYNGEFIGTLQFVNGTASGTLTIPDSLADFMGGEYFIEGNEEIPVQIKERLTFLSEEYSGSLVVQMLSEDDKFPQGEAYISDTHTEIKTDSVWSNSELMRGIIPSNHIIPSDLHEQGEAIVSVWGGA